MNITAYLSEYYRLSACAKAANDTHHSTDGNLDGIDATYKQVTALKPCYNVTHCNLGNMLK